MLNDLIIKKIEEKYGQQICYSKDCETLAIQISAQAGGNISTSTVKRLFGFVKTSSNPNQYTLDIVAKYLEYKDWNELEKQLILKPNEKHSEIVIRKTKINRTTIFRKWLVLILLVGSILSITLIYLQYKPTIIEWKELANLPEVRSGGGVIMYKNSIYYIGGGDAEFVNSNNWEFNVKDNKWRLKASMPTAKGEFGCTRIDSLIYCFGGWLGNNIGATNVVEVYNINTNEWENLMPLPKAIMSCKAVSYKSKIYLLNGSLGETKNQFRCFNPSIGVYDELPVFERQRNHFGMVILGHKIYVLGGMSFTKGEYLWHNNVDVYDIEKKQWTKAADLPVKIARNDAVVKNGEIHILGGSDVYGPEKNGIQNLHYVYNPKDNKWTEFSILPFAVTGHQCVVFDNKIILLGGTHEFPNPSKKAFQEN